MPTTESSTRYVKKKAIFSIDSQRRNSIRITNNPIIPSAFLKNINATVDTESMEKLSLTTINKWLLKQGYIVESEVPAVINKKVKTITRLSEQIGIIEQTIVDQRNGEAKMQLLFTKQVQEFILDNLDVIISM